MPSGKEKRKQGGGFTGQGEIDLVCQKTEPLENHRVWMIINTMTNHLPVESPIWKPILE